MFGSASAQLQNHIIIYNEQYLFLIFFLLKVLQSKTFFSPFFKSAHTLFAPTARFCFHYII